MCMQCASTAMVTATAAAGSRAFLAAWIRAHAGALALRAVSGVVIVAALLAAGLAGASH